MNQTVKRDLKDIWICLQCGEKVIPFVKSNSAGFVEGAIFIIGAIMALAFNLFLGLILIASSVIIGVLRSSGNGKKLCPSCESENIVPSTSPIAKRVKI